MGTGFCPAETVTGITVGAVRDSGSPNASLSWKKKLLTTNLTGASNGSILDTSYRIAMVTFCCALSDWPMVSTTGCCPEGAPVGTIAFTWRVPMLRYGAAPA